MLKRSVALFFVSLLLACGDDGDDPSTFSCDLRTATMPQDYCQEYTGLNGPGLVDPYQDGCTGTWTAAECPHEDSLGGCRTPESDEGIVITNWFFAGDDGAATATDIMASCTSPDMYVSP